MWDFLVSFLFGFFFLSKTYSSSPKRQRRAMEYLDTAWQTKNTFFFWCWFSITDISNCHIIAFITSQSQCTVSCTDALCSEVYVAGWELLSYLVLCWEPSASFLKDPCFHMLLTPCRQLSSSLHSKYAPFPKHIRFYSITPFRDTSVPAKDLMRLKTVLSHLPESI